MISFLIIFALSLLLARICKQHDDLRDRLGAKTVADLKRIAEMEELILVMWTKGDFRNGNTDQSGSTDEGDCLMGRLVEHVLGRH